MEPARRVSSGDKGGVEGYGNWLSRKSAYYSAVLAPSVATVQRVMGVAWTAVSSATTTVYGACQRCKRPKREAERVLQSAGLFPSSALTPQYKGERELPTSIENYPSLADFYPHKSRQGLEAMSTDQWRPERGQWVFKGRSAAWIPLNPGHWEKKGTEDIWVEKKKDQ